MLFSRCLYGSVPFVSFYINGTERTCRTKVLTGSATDAPFGVDGWDFRRIGYVRVRKYHGDGACRTMPRTVTTIHSVGQRHTVCFCPNSMAYLNRRFIGYGNGMYSPGPDKHRRILYIPVGNSPVRMTFPAA